MLESENDLLDFGEESLEDISYRIKCLTFDGQYAKFKHDNLFSTRSFGILEYV